MPTVCVRDVNTNTDVIVHPYDVLDEMDHEDIMDYLQKRRSSVRGISGGFDYVELAHSYFHRDFDLKKFFKEVGIKEVHKVLAEVGA